MKILGIETSCDETAAAIVEDGRKILSNVVASSVEFHRKTGGIIPEVAAREQLRCIIPVIKEAMGNTKDEKRKTQEKKSFTPNVSCLTCHDIDAIAVTVGPGLIGSLLVGVETAKALAFAWQKPLIPINHLQAHLYANFIRELPISKFQIPNFPAIGLVVSGGHTDLVLMKNHQQIEWVGGTRDDAAGECFDKCARLLGLDYPGGPAISATAEKCETKNVKREMQEIKREFDRNSYHVSRITSHNIRLPRPMINEDNFDFSFSGLKTAVLNRVKEQESRRVKINISEFAYEIQEAITDVLVAKTKKAAEKFKVKSVLLAGGVTANPRLREKFKLSIINYQLSIPEQKLCTDNATFVASCAYFNFHPLLSQKIFADSSLEIEEMIK